MEEQRQRQEDEARRAGTVNPAETPAANTNPVGAPSNEDAMLERALAMSMDQPSSIPTGTVSSGSALASFPDFSAMTEEEQIAYAMQMSMQEARKLIWGNIISNLLTKIKWWNILEGGKTEPEAMEVEQAPGGSASDDYDEVMNDPAFLQSVLETLPGVDPSSDAVQSAVVALRNQEKDKKNDQSKKPDSK